ncbi:hypothetical protein [Sphingosinicella sp. BN140058]|uniref:hypothetical protein n=1 Tax=Sphingosinicella sp. BN140058 TaxID=1892855 RepID=UPI001011424F|nr:hypothetical protein [Sphingosinicella sp. BN140058]QAY79403.1 hypothetical protein ETR14_24825 [Sphingosinicella sp. BN140058]
MSGRLARLSMTALRMAAGILPAASAPLASWLYHFGTLPRTEALERDFGLDDEPLAVLGLASGGPARACLEAAFEASTHPGWISFAGNGAAGAVPPACKLYVSPEPRALPYAFPIVAHVFARAGVRSFKVGRGLHGLLRSDKIVAYFDAREHLDDVARSLGRALGDCPAQGIAFTADAGGDGLLSWGADPPDPSSGASWRAWITRRLAEAMIANPHAPVPAACEAMRSVGIDPELWAPSEATFQ